MYNWEKGFELEVGSENQENIAGIFKKYLDLNAFILRTI